MGEDGIFSDSDRGDILNAPLCIKSTGVSKAVPEEGKKNQKEVGALEAFVLQALGATCLA